MIPVKTKRHPVGPQVDVLVDGPELWINPALVLFVQPYRVARITEVVLSGGKTLLVEGDTRDVLELLSGTERKERKR